MNTEDFIVPTDEVGWTDDTFDEAFRYVMNHTELVDVVDMQMWVKNNIEPGPQWFFQKVAINGGLRQGSTYKTSILSNFKMFPPSTLHDAFYEVMTRPRPRRKSRNFAYRAMNIISTIIGLIAAAGLIAYLIMQI